MSRCWRKPWGFLRARARNDLTADDLKELGVNSLGHRKKVLTAAGLLQQRDAGTPLAGKPDKIHSEGPKSEQKEVSERRQVTVLFADLVAYTRLASNGLVKKHRPTSERKSCRHPA